MPLGCDVFFVFLFICLDEESIGGDLMRPR